MQVGDQRQAADELGDAGVREPRCRGLAFLQRPEQSLPRGMTGDREQLVGLGAGASLRRGPSDRDRDFSEHRPASRGGGNLGRQVPAGKARDEDRGGRRAFVGTSGWPGRAGGSHELADGAGCVLPDQVLPPRDIAGRPGHGDTEPGSRRGALAAGWRNRGQAVRPANVRLPRVRDEPGSHASAGDELGQQGGCIGRAHDRSVHRPPGLAQPGSGQAEPVDESSHLARTGDVNPAVDDHAHADRPRLS